MANKRSFAAVDEYFNQIIQETDMNNVLTDNQEISLTIILIGNNHNYNGDLRSKIEVSFQDCVQYAKSKKIPFIQISDKDEQSGKSVFEIALRYVSKCETCR